MRNNLCMPRLNLNMRWSSFLSLIASYKVLIHASQKYKDFKEKYDNICVKIANKHGQEILKSRCPVSNKKRFHKTDNQEPFPYHLIYL